MHLDDMHGRLTRSGVGTGCALPWQQQGAAVRNARIAHAFATCGKRPMFTFGPKYDTAPMLIQATVENRGRGRSAPAAGGANDWSHARGSAAAFPADLG